jgi:hypothetical protein
MTIDLPPRPSNKTELIARVREQYRLLSDLANGLPNEALTVPLVDWSVKDHLAHLAAWQGAALAAMRGVYMHEGLGLPAPPVNRRDWDAMNATLHAQWQNVPFAEVQRRLDEGNESILAAVQHASEEALQGRYLDREAPEGVTIIDVVSANSYEHYLEHRTWIREQLVQTGRLPS